MNKMFWKLIAWFVTRPCVTAWILETAARTPDDSIGDYMDRDWLFRIKKVWKYKNKKWVFRFPISIRVHYTYKPDADPYVHDHPWDWRTIVLENYYIEEDSQGKKHYRVKGDTAARSAFDPHRITKVSAHGPVITLFIMYRWKNDDWGFYVGNPARKIPYRDYESINNRGDTPHV